MAAEQREITWQDAKNAYVDIRKSLESAWGRFSDSPVEIESFMTKVSVLKTFVEQLTQQINTDPVDLEAAHKKLDTLSTIIQEVSELFNLNQLNPLHVETREKIISVLCRSDANEELRQRLTTDLGLTFIGDRSRGSDSKHIASLQTQLMALGLKVTAPLAKALAGKKRKASEEPAAEEKTPVSFEEYSDFSKATKDLTKTTQKLVTNFGNLLETAKYAAQEEDPRHGEYVQTVNALEQAVKDAQAEVVAAQEVYGKAIAAQAIVIQQVEGEMRQAKKAAEIGHAAATGRRVSEISQLDLTNRATALSAAHQTLQQAAAKLETADQAVQSAEGALRETANEDTQEAFREAIRKQVEAKQEYEDAFSNAVRVKNAYNEAKHVQIAGAAKSAKGKNYTASLDEVVRAVSLKEAKVKRDHQEKVNRAELFLELVQDKVEAAQTILDTPAHTNHRMTVHHAAKAASELAKAAQALSAAAGVVFNESPQSFNEDKAQIDRFKESFNLPGIDKEKIDPMIQELQERQAKTKAQQRVAKKLINTAATLSLQARNLSTSLSGNDHTQVSNNTMALLKEAAALLAQINTQNEINQAISQLEAPVAQQPDLLAIAGRRGSLTKEEAQEAAEYEALSEAAARAAQAAFHDQDAEVDAYTYEELHAEATAEAKAEAAKKAALLARISQSSRALVKRFDRNQVARLKTEKDVLQTQVRTLASEHDALLSVVRPDSPAAALSEKISTLTEEQRTLKAQVETLQTQLASSKKSIAKFEENQGTSREKVKELENKKASFEQALSLSSEGMTEDQRLDFITKNITPVENELAALEQNIENSKKAFAQLKAKMEERTTALQTAQKALQANMAKLEQAEQAALHMTQSEQSIALRLTEIADEQAGLLSKIQAIETELSKFTESNEEPSDEKDAVAVAAPSAADNAPVPPAMLSEIAAFAPPPLLSEIQSGAAVPLTGRYSASDVVQQFGVVSENTRKASGAHVAAAPADQQQEQQQEQEQEGMKKQS